MGAASSWPGATPRPLLSLLSEWAPAVPDPETYKAVSRAASVGSAEVADFSRMRKSAP